MEANIQHHTQHNLVYKISLQRHKSLIESLSEKDQGWQVAVDNDMLKGNCGNKSWKHSHKTRRTMWYIGYCKTCFSSGRNKEARHRNSMNSRSNIDLKFAVIFVSCNNIYAMKFLRIHKSNLEYSDFDFCMCMDRTMDNFQFCTQLNSGNCKSLRRKC